MQPWSYKELEPRIVQDRTSWAAFALPLETSFLIEARSQKSLTEGSLAISFKEPLNTAAKVVILNTAVKNIATSTYWINKKRADPSGRTRGIILL